MHDSLNEYLELQRQYHSLASKKSRAKQRGAAVSELRVMDDEMFDLKAKMQHLEKQAQASKGV